MKCHIMRAMANLKCALALVCRMFAGNTPEVPESIRKIWEEVPDPDKEVPEPVLKDTEEKSNASKLVVMIRCDRSLQICDCVLSEANICFLCTPLDLSISCSRGKV